MMKSSVFKNKKDNKWYFYNETWSDVYGPYNTEKDAEFHLNKYGKLLRESISDDCVNCNKCMDFGNDLFCTAIKGMHKLLYPYRNEDDIICYKKPEWCPKENK